MKTINILMPEIVEVRQTADLIRRKLKNKFITEVNLLNGRYRKKPFANYKKLVQKLPLKVLDVKTKGKLVYLIFEGDLYLINTFGLSGGWCYSNDNKNFTFPDTIDLYSKYNDGKYDIDKYIENNLNHLNVEFKTKNGSMYYYDVLSFGTIKILDNRDDFYRILDKLGPDIMDPDTTFPMFAESIMGQNNLNKSIGNVIVNQKVISGIGNYLRSDILYLSKVNPFLEVKYLNKNDLRRIYKYSRLLTWKNYNYQYAIDNRIINNHLPKKYDRLFFVYGQDVDIYGNEVKTEQLYEGSKPRIIYYVPSIQK